MLARSLFRPVRDRNIFEATVERLAQGIRLGLVPTGNRLPPERELAEALAVSRVTLREAIKALRQAGMVDSRRGRTGGTFVIYDAGDRPAPDEGAEQVARRMGAALDEALDFRRVVEPGTAALAASRPLMAGDRQALRVALVECTGATDDASRRMADSRLHLTIAGAAGCQPLATAVAEGQIRLDELLRAIPVIRRNIAHSDAQHAAVVDAILAGDPERSRRHMEEHVDATAALLRGFLG
ncbi:MAG: FadR/GntR family transcriptional regulator [Actinomycetes bacterium]